MKLRNTLAVIGAVTVLAGCSENDRLATQPQSMAPAVTNEAKDPATPAPAVAPQVNTKPNDSVTPPAPPDAAANPPQGTAPNSSDPADKK